MESCRPALVNSCWARPYPSSLPAERRLAESSRKHRRTDCNSTPNDFLELDANRREYGRRSRLVEYRHIQKQVGVVDKVLQGDVPITVTAERAIKVPTRIRPEWYGGHGAGADVHEPDRRRRRQRPRTARGGPAPHTDRRPRATSVHASSRLAQVVTARPSRGRVCNRPMWVFCQSHDGRQHCRLALVVPFQRSGELNAPAVLGGDEVGGNETEHDIGAGDGVVDLVFQSAPQDFAVIPALDESSRCRALKWTSSRPFRSSSLRE